MKGARLLPMLTGLILSLVSILSAAERTGTVNEPRVNVRGKPSLSSEVITQVRQGEPVTVLEEITDKNAKTNEPSKWLKIVMPANTPLWVNTNFLDEANAVKSTKLNVRGGPGEQYSVVGTLKKGDKVKTIRTVGDWMEVETPENSYGFVAASLVTLGPPAAVETVKTETKPVEMVETQRPVERVESQRPVERVETAKPSERIETVKTETKPQEVAKVEERPVVTEEKKSVEPVPAEEKKNEEVVVTNPPEIVGTPVEKTAEQTPERVEQPATTPPPSVEKTDETKDVLLPKRIVTREGLVKRAKSIQSPTSFALENQLTGEIMNYLHATDPDINLKIYHGYKVIVTGEELIDPRWPAIPLIHVEKIQLP